MCKAFVTVVLMGQGIARTDPFWALVFAPHCEDITVKFLKIQTPEEFAVIILKFEQDGFTKEKCVQMMHMEWQTV